MYVLRNAKKQIKELNLVSISILLISHENKASLGIEFFNFSLKSLLKRKFLRLSSWYSSSV